MPKKLMECILVNRASDGFCAYLRRDQHTELLFQLAECIPEGDAPRHPLGGFEISLSSEADLEQWLHSYDTPFDPSEAKPKIVALLTKSAYPTAEDEYENNPSVLKAEEISRFREEGVVAVPKAAFTVDMASA